MEAECLSLLLMTKLRGNDYLSPNGLYSDDFVTEDKSPSLALFTFVACGVVTLNLDCSFSALTNFRENAPLSFSVLGTAKLAEEDTLLS